jgi:hypothetical protein
MPGAPPTAGAPGPRPAPPAPAPSPRVALAPPTLVAGRLVTAVSGPAGARARVAGTVIVRGRRLALPPVTARLGARPMTLRLVLPRQALIAGAPRRLRIVLAVTVTGRGARSTVRRTVTVTRR